MTLMDALTVISLVVGIASIALAIFSIWLGAQTEKESRRNFERTQQMMQDFYEKTKDLLNQVDKRAGVTETVVKDNQDKLLSTMTTILNETVIPKKQDASEQLMLAFFQQLFTNPGESGKMMDALKSMVEIGNLVDSNKGK